MLVHLANRVDQSVSARLLGGQDPAHPQVGGHGVDLDGVIARGVEQGQRRHCAVSGGGVEPAGQGHHPPVE
jgi:hypothetical protein